MPKYTDEQIKKMLGTIIKQNEHKVLNGIPNNICCLNMELTKAMRDLINRQEAEIERLSAENEQLGNDVDGKMKYIYELEERIKTAKSEAIKKFAEILQTRLHNTEYKLTSNAKCITAEEEKSTIDWILHKYVIRIIDEVEYGMVGEGE